MQVSIKEFSIKRAKLVSYTKDFEPYRELNLLNESFCYFRVKEVAQFDDTYDLILVLNNWGNLKNLENEDLIQEIRQIYPNTPLFFLGADLVLSDSLALYEGGVDLIIKWPLPIVELSMMIKKFLKYRNVYNDDLRLNKESMELIIKGEVYPLTNIELKILDLLMANKGGLISHDQLSGFVWEDLTVKKGALNTHIYNLKKRIPALKQMIQCKKGRGYFLRKEIF